MGPAPRIVIAGWAGAGNVGDELLARWTITQLRAHQLCPVLLSNDPASSSKLHGVECVDGRSLRAVASAIRRSDGLVFGPGGIVQDSSSAWSLLFHMWRPLVANLSSIPWVGVGLGAEPLEHRTSKVLARRILGRAIATTVRDPGSAQVFETLAVDVEQGDDVVFGLPVSATERRDVVAVAIGPEIDRSSSRWRAAAKRLDTSNVELVASALHRVRETTEMPIVMASFRGSRDFDFAERVSAEIGGGIDVEEVDIDNAASWCASANVMITSRFHSAVLAIANQTPTIVWPRSAKTTSLGGRWPKSVVLASPDQWAAAIDSARRLSVEVDPIPPDTSPHELAIAALAQRLGSSI